MTDLNYNAYLLAEICVGVRFILEVFHGKTSNRGNRAIYALSRSDFVYELLAERGELSVLDDDLYHDYVEFCFSFVTTVLKKSEPTASSPASSK